jgi:hypothetical protein
MTGPRIAPGSRRQLGLINGRRAAPVKDLRGKGATAA